MGRELEVAVEAARASGEVLRRSFGTDLNVRFKGPVDLVTEVDVESERVAKAILREAFPDYAVLAEESGRTRGTENARWIIDPVDGTTNYAHGLPLVAVTIALEVAGELEVGVVYNPILEEMFVAERGGGATRNGAPIGVSDTDDLSLALIVSGFPYDRALVPEALELWNEFTLRSQGMRRLGSAALDICYVATGQFDGYYEVSVFPWDIAAAVLVLTEAGGRVSDYSGEALDIESGRIVASNGRIHDQMVEITRRSLAGRRA